MSHPPDPPPSDESPPNRPKRITSVLRAVISLGIVAGIFVGVLPKIADYGEVWNTITAMTWLELTSLGLIALWNVVTYWFVMVASMPRLKYSQAAIVNQASTAISNTLPGGGAIGVGVTYSMYTSWGFTKPEIARAVVVSGIWNNFMKLGFPIVALALLAVEGGVSAALLIASLFGLSLLIGAIVSFGLVLRSDRLARNLGDWLGRLLSRARALLKKAPVTTMGESTARFRTDTVELLSARWFGLTLASLVSHASLYVVLLVALRHVGVGQEEVTWITILAAFAFVRLISALPITPGGIGVVELGYVAALTIGLGDDLKAQVVAAVLVFRFLTFFLPIPAGAAAYTYWRRSKRWRQSTTDGFTVS